MIIRLKWGQTEYRGKLESIDSYMNVLLRDTEEFIDGKNTGTLGLVLIRCVFSILFYAWFCARPVDRKRVSFVGMFKFCSSIHFMNEAEMEC